MASYPPPTNNISVFDTSNFPTNVTTGGLTEEQANSLYYKYPVGQPLQTLQQTNHTGLATYQAGIDIQSGSLQFADNTIQTTAASSINTTQITYDPFFLTTYIFETTSITSLSCGNFNTTYLSGMTSNIQNQINSAAGNANTALTNSTLNLTYEYKIGGYDASTGAAFPSSLNFLAPANAVYADVMVIGIGGIAGDGNDRTAGGFFSGGSGGGACASSGRIYCRNQTLNVSNTGSNVQFSVGGILVITVQNGNTGGAASLIAGGVAGAANASAPTIALAGYTTWFSYTGTIGSVGRANLVPANVGIVQRTGFDVSGQMGVGQSCSGFTNGVNAYPIETTYFGGAFVTFYSK